MKKIENIFSKKLTYIILFVIFFAVVVFIKPFIDDWHYYTTPQTTFNISGLLPSAVWWRPLDYLVGLLLGLFPALFPALNHFIVILGHIIGAYFLHSILIKYFKLSEKIAFISTLFFLFSAGTFAALGSVDSLNQIWSQTFGIIALYLFYKHSETKKLLPYILSIIMCLLAVFSKDSGIIWFAVIPFLGELPMLLNGEYEHDNHKKTAIKILKYLLIAAVFCILYFALRFWLLGGIALGSDNSAYAMSLSPVRMVRNLAVMLAANFTAIDSVSVFLKPRNYIVLLITTVLSLPFIMWVFVEIIKTFKSKIKLIILLLIAATTLVAVSPYLVMYAAGEMHAYQLVFFVSILVAFLLNNNYENKYALPSPSKNKIKKNTVISTVFISFLICSVVVSGHKFILMKNLGDSSQYVAKQICSEYTGVTPPENVAIIVMKNEPKGYSIFYQPAGECAKYGYSCKSEWGWKYPETITYFYTKRTQLSKNSSEEIMKECNINNESYDAVWIVSSAGEHIVLNKGIDY